MRLFLTNMKHNFQTNGADLEAVVLKPQQPVLGSPDSLSGHSAEPSHARRTSIQRAPQVVKLVRRIVISWLDGPLFQPKLHSAISIYPRVPASRIRRRMIRRHNILSPELCLFNDIH
jgi:hypothetical protein